MRFDQSVPRSDVRRYLFNGYTKSLYPEVAFDSTAEKDFATILEKGESVIKWIRPPDGNVPIVYRGREYNPDFLVETAESKYMIEIKMAKELFPVLDKEVEDKAKAAIRWCQAASDIKGAKRWEYRLVPDNAVESTRDLHFVLGQAVKLVAS